MRIFKIKYILLSWDIQHSCSKNSALLTLMSIPCTFSMLGLSTIHYLSNSKKQMLVASIFSIICLMLAPITILANKHLPVERLSIAVYGIIAVIFIIFGSKRLSGNFDYEFKNIY